MTYQFKIGDLVRPNPISPKGETPTLHWCSSYNIDLETVGVISAYEPSMWHNKGGIYVDFTDRHGKKWHEGWWYAHNWIKVGSPLQEMIRKIELDISQGQ